MTDSAEPIQPQASVDASGRQDVATTDRNDNNDGPVRSSSDQGAGPVQVQAGEGGKYSVDARGGMAVQVGEVNTQIIYAYNRLTWTDGVAPPPLVSVSGLIDSPYRGLSAFEEQDAQFFCGRETATIELLERMSRL